MQNGATSIVGQCIIQLARHRGIHSINIIRDRCCFSSKPFSVTFLVYLSIVCLFLCILSMPFLHLCSVSVVAFAWCNRFASSSSGVMSRFDKMNSRLASFFPLNFAKVKFNQTRCTHWPKKVHELHVTKHCSYQGYFQHNTAIPKNP